MAQTQRKENGETSDMRRNKRRNNEIKWKDNNTKEIKTERNKVKNKVNKEKC